MNELVRCCKYCKQDMRKTRASEWIENPFCNNCLQQRLQINKLVPGNWETDGTYLTFQPTLEK